MQTINLQGEQVEFQERKEKHDLRKEINSLLVTVGRVSKRQFLEYFADNKQEQVGYLLHQMVQTGEVCEPEEGVYLPDARFLDTSYYKTTKIHGSENVYADMQKYTGHLTQLQKNSRHSGCSWTLRNGCRHRTRWRSTAGSFRLCYWHFLQMDVYMRFWKSWKGRNHNLPFLQVKNVMRALQGRCAAS